MRAAIAAFILGPLLGCAAPEDTYQPRANVALSVLEVEGRPSAAYIRHSRGAVMVHLTPLDEAFDSPHLKAGLVLTLGSCLAGKSTPGADVFGDGTVVLVPLSGKQTDASGVLISLMSGQRYFLAPRALSSAERARLQRTNRNWRGIRVIVPGDERSAASLPRFPDFAE